MKTSWNNPKKIEQFLNGHLTTPENLLFKARLLIDPIFRKNVAAQQKTYALVKQYCRQKLKNQLENIHRNLFNNPTKTEYQQEINNIFNQQ